MATVSARYADGHGPYWVKVTRLELAEMLYADLEAKAVEYFALLQQERYLRGQVKANEIAIKALQRWMKSQGIEPQTPSAS